MLKYKQATTEGGFLMRQKVILVCSDCLSRNYTTDRNKQVSEKRLELKKYCAKCNAHTVHKETK